MNSERLFEYMDDLILQKDYARLIKVFDSIMANSTTVDRMKYTVELSKWVSKHSSNKELFAGIENARISLNLSKLADLENLQKAIGDGDFSRAREVFNELYNTGNDSDMVMANRIKKANKDFDRFYDSRALHP